MVFKKINRKQQQKRKKGIKMEKRKAIRNIVLLGVLVVFALAFKTPSADTARNLIWAGVALLVVAGACEVIVLFTPSQSTSLRP